MNNYWLMSCCKLEDHGSQRTHLPPPKPKYKYSFKHRSKILVDSLSTSAGTYPYDASKSIA